MKIIHISHLYHPSKGGVQFFFKNVSERLVKDYGDDVTVVTTNSYYGPERKIFRKIEPAEEVINGVKIMRFSYRRWHIKPYSFIYKILGKLSLKKPDWMLHQSNGPCSGKMKKFLMNLEADAFCASSSNYHYMQLPLWKKCNFFYFGSIHLPEDEKTPALNKRQYNSISASSLYIANTHFEKKRLIQAGVDSKKIAVVGVGVEPEAFEVTRQEVDNFKTKLCLPNAKNAVVIGYVGRIERTKNVLVLIKSFEQLAKGNADTYLLIAGSGGEYADELKRYCKSLSPNISARILWKIDFNSNEKAALFNALDILVLPSSNESFGIVFLEAWACKKPVVGASIGAVRDVICDGVDGLLMERDCEKSLFEKLQKLVADELLRSTMGQNGFDKVHENYTWDKITARLRKHYQDGKPANNN